MRATFTASCSGLVMLLVMSTATAIPVPSESTNIASSKLFATVMRAPDSASIADARWVVISTSWLIACRCWM